MEAKNDPIKLELQELRNKLEDMLPTSKWSIVAWWARCARPFFEHNAPYLLDEFDRHTSEPNYIVMRPPLEHMGVVDPWMYHAQPMLATPSNKRAANLREHRRLLAWLDAVIKDWDSPKRLKKSGYVILMLGRRISFHTLFLCAIVVVITSITVWATLQ